MKFHGKCGHCGKTFIAVSIEILSFTAVLILVVKFVYVRQNKAMSGNMFNIHWISKIAYACLNDVYLIEKGIIWKILCFNFVCSICNQICTNGLL